MNAYIRISTQNTAQLLLNYHKEWFLLAGVIVLLFRKIFF